MPPEIPEVEKIFWCRLRQARLMAGLTQVALARQLGVTTRTVKRWEEPSHTPCLSDALLIAAALRLKVEDVWRIEVVVPDGLHPGR